MTETQKRLLIRLYFTQFPIWPAPVLLGFGILLSSDCLGWWLLTTGVLYSAILVAAQFVGPTDSQIDEWLNEDVQALRGKALQMLDLEESDIQVTRPLQLAGPLLHDTPHVRREHLRYREGRDRAYRVSVISVLILLPTKDYLGVFRCIQDSIRNETYQAEATEYAYRNVVAVKFGEETDVFKGKEENWLKTRNGRLVLPGQFFSISISNGERFGVPVRARVAEDRPTSEPPMTELDQMVRAIRKLLQPKFEAT